MEHLEAPFVLALLIFWFVIWLVFLRLLPASVSDSESLEVPSEPDSAAKLGKDVENVAVENGAAKVAPCRSSLVFYHKKLRRMQIFAVLASISGLAIFLQCFIVEEPLVEMLTGFGPAHQVCFTMALSHWVINIWEDWRTRMFLAQGLSGNTAGGLALFPLNLLCTPPRIMQVMYAIHHTVTIFAYSYSLITHRLGGVLVQGLLFEMPVVFMLRRELAVATEPSPAWLHNEDLVNIHWLVTYAAFLVGRGCSSVLWLLSVIPGYGADRLQDLLHVEDLIAYHTFAVFFTSLNCRVFILLMCWHGQDAEKARSRNQVSPGEAPSIAKATSDRTQ